MKHPSDSAVSRLNCSTLARQGCTSQTLPVAFGYTAGLHPAERTASTSLCENRHCLRRPNITRMQIELRTCRPPESNKELQEATAASTHATLQALGRMLKTAKTGFPGSLKRLFLVSRRCGGLYSDQSPSWRVCAGWPLYKRRAMSPWTSL